MQVLQIWYAAVNQNQFNEVDDPELFSAASQYFPRFKFIDRRMQLSMGAAYLAEQKRLPESEFAC